MFDIVTFNKEIDDLVSSDREKQAEQRMLKAYSELSASDNVEVLGHVVRRLAHFYSMPGTENIEKAEAYFLESERLSPTAYAKCQTATFYFYVVCDLQRVVTKVNDIRSLDGDRRSYYSALCLKGEALIKLSRLSEAERVITELIDFIKANPLGLAYGDEMNLVEAAISIPVLAQRSRELLKLSVPNMRSQEYKERANTLLRRGENGIC